MSGGVWGVGSGGVVVGWERLWRRVAACGSCGAVALAVAVAAAVAVALAVAVAGAGAVTVAVSEVMTDRVYD